jgi:hypothetical protein
VLPPWNPWLILCVPFLDCKLQEPKSHGEEEAQQRDRCRRQQREIKKREGEKGEKKKKEEE